MQNIIRLIQKYRYFIIFILLQFFAFTLIFSWKNSFQHYTFVSSSNKIFGIVYDINSSITDYFSLSYDNQKLQEENSELKIKLYNKRKYVGRENINTQNVFIPVDIISSNYKFSNNYLSINKGHLDGIRINQGLIGTLGVLGIVMSCSDNYSSVLPIINPKFELPVVHEETGSFGLLKWREDNSWLFAIIDDIPVYEKIKKDDIFISSGAAGIFPRGIEVGRVMSLKEIPNSQFQEITIKLAEDYTKISSGYIVINSKQDEYLEINENK
jgi:rod shape-determining protein MreC